MAIKTYHVIICPIYTLISLYFQEFTLLIAPISHHQHDKIYLQQNIHSMAKKRNNRIEYENSQK